MGRFSVLAEEQKMSEPNRREFLRLGISVIAATAAPEGLLAWLKNEDFKLYEVNGQTWFPMYDENFRLTSRIVSYLICRRENEVYSYGFDPSIEPEEKARAIFQRAIDAGWK